MRLGDVATCDRRLRTSYLAGSWYSDKRGLVLAVHRQPGSNTIEVIDKIKAILPQFEADLPTGVQAGNLLRPQRHHPRLGQRRADDAADRRGAGGGVIFVFLRRLSATIIPSLALPIAVIGTFAGMALMGYNLDNLSLMALTLSVGFVVDDAIVMLENIVRHIEHGEKPYDAAINGSGEIGFTILSMTLSLAAVFIPVVFMGGIVGRLLHEFAITIIIAIAFSGIISVTLTPMLCARVLKDEHGQAHGAFYRWSENTFNRHPERL